ncbi:MAG: YhcH/YjgK/YiaL family protein [Bacteroidales bacterium]|nr:YhcH/YjgK/YiaL family protein [Bacteroidales bacterium]
MAIIGSVATLEKQADSKYSKVFEYIRNTDHSAVFATIAAGATKTVEIDGKNIFAIYQTNLTKPHDKARLEGHRKYADVQYVVDGQEFIGFSPIENIAAEPDYDEAKDIFFCDSQKKMSQLLVSEGEAVILEPSDLHAPCIMVGEPKPVKKIVFKVKI